MPLDRYQYNLAEMFSRWSSIKIVQAGVIRQNMAAEGWVCGAYFSYISI